MLGVGFVIGMFCGIAIMVMLIISSGSDNDK